METKTEELKVTKIKEVEISGETKKIIFIEQSLYKDFAENPRIKQIKFKTRRN